MAKYRYTKNERQARRREWQAVAQQKLDAYRFGKLGAASLCVRIDPVTGVRTLLEPCRPTGTNVEESTMKVNQVPKVRSHHFYQATPTTQSNPSKRRYRFVEKHWQLDTRDPFSQLRYADLRTPPWAD